MLRRLFFILPDESHALAVLRDIEAAGIEHRHIHAIPGKGVTLTQLPVATIRQQHDTVWRLEQTFWFTNLVVFMLAFAGFLWAFYVMHLTGIIAALIVMILTLFGGIWFAIKVPDTHLAECRQALAHGEIVLLVDVPKRRVEEIGDIVEHRHPEATRGGTGWTLDALGI
jgi:hypothetical protein